LKTRKFKKKSFHFTFPVVHINRVTTEWKGNANKQVQCEKNYYTMFRSYLYRNPRKLQHAKKWQTQNCNSTQDKTSKIKQVR